jgi:hypothetical protein
LEIFAMLTEAQGLMILKEILARPWGIGLDTGAHHWTLMTRKQVEF